LDAKLVRTSKEDVIIFCAVAPTDRQRTLEAMGVQVERVDPETGSPGGPARRVGDPIRRSGVSLSQVMKRLGELDVLSVMIEAGAQLNGSAISGKHVDKLTLFYAPVFLGPGAVPLLQDAIGGPLLASPPLIESIGQDVRVDAYLRDPWA
jgi:diaminohydroxyphosphoribosylaminopyrimidine deaminase/5-amino-6-(5-phosphoribosylamino)uracil reductase